MSAAGAGTSKVTIAKLQFIPMPLFWSWVSFRLIQEYEQVRNMSGGHLSKAMCCCVVEVFTFFRVVADFLTSMFA